VKPFLRNSLIGAAAALLSGLCTVALPLVKEVLNHQDAAKPGPRIAARVSLKSVESPKPELKPRRELRQPKRARPAPSLLKSGPRFAMDLGVAGSDGAAAPIDIVNRKSGGGGRGAGDGDDGVDERPAPSFPPPFRMPQEVKAREKDALLVLSFCVDVSGRPYDIKVAEEKPPGLGMAAAGREALGQTRFAPAKKGGAAVPFCGLEQPFEVRFSN
jgi:protein TonB